MRMRIFDRIEIDTLDRRDWQLWLLAISMIVILGAGVAVLMYPSVFGAAPGPNTPVFQRIFMGFCVLNFLFVVYVLDRQFAVRQLRRSLAAEQKRNAELRVKASSELLHSLPNFAHFQDRLAMQFRRAVNSREPLSMLVVGLRPSAALSDPIECETAYGDAVQAILRKLRAEDSIYRIRAGVFGILLPGLPRSGASLVASRLSESLMDVAGAGARFSCAMETVSYPEHVAAAHEMEEAARSRFTGGDTELALVSRRT
jgi:GGDEF domain-containing protein